MCLAIPMRRVLMCNGFLSRLTRSALVLMLWYLVRCTAMLQVPRCLCVNSQSWYLNSGMWSTCMHLGAYWLLTWPNLYLEETPHPQDLPITSHLLHHGGALSAGLAGSQLRVPGDLKSMLFQFRLYSIYILLIRPFWVAKAPSVCLHIAGVVIYCSTHIRIHAFHYRYEHGVMMDYFFVTKTLHAHLNCDCKSSQHLECRKVLAQRKGLEARWVHPPRQAWTPCLCWNVMHVRTIGCSVPCASTARAGKMPYSSVFYVIQHSFHKNIHVRTLGWDNQHK